jgi:hypothetical protein
MMKNGYLKFFLWNDILILKGFFYLFKGDDQVVLCTKDGEGHVYVHNMFVGVQTPQYISRGRPSYGLRETDGYSNATHIICKFVRKLSPHSDTSGDTDGKNRDGVDREKFIDLRKPHYMYPVYANQDLMTSQGRNLNRRLKGKKNDLIFRYAYSCTRYSNC